MQIPQRVISPNAEEKQKALEILGTGTSYGGENTQRFEVELAKWCHRRYGVAPNSGTSTCLLALEATEIGPGDEVILPANGDLGVLAAVIESGATTGRDR